MLTYSGAVIFHPDKYLKNTDFGHEKWFPSLTDQGGGKVIKMSGEPILSRFGFFAPWNGIFWPWIPWRKCTGPSTGCSHTWYALFIFAAAPFQLALMLLTARLTHPLKELLTGTQAFGKGNLDTRINIGSDDEFGLLAKEFNRMAFRLQDSLTALKQMKSISGH